MNMQEFMTGSGQIKRTKSDVFRQMVANYRADILFIDRRISEWAAICRKHLTATTNKDTVHMQHAKAMLQRERLAKRLAYLEALEG